jgi:hypothetical protein
VEFGIGSSGVRGLARAFCGARGLGHRKSYVAARF